MSPQYTLQEVFQEKEWHPLGLNTNAPFTQSFEYGTWQESIGRRVRRFEISQNGTPVSFFQLIFYPLIGEKKYGYVPYGPVAMEWTSPLLAFIKKEIKRIMKEENAVFTRLDFTPVIPKTEKDIFHAPPLSSYSGSNFQPRYEWVLPLEKTEDGLLASMHQKMRYNIRLAEKKGVKIEIVEKDFLSHLPAFYNLLARTASRNSFSLHDEKYYENIFRSLEGKKNGYLSVASYEGKILAMDFIFIYGETAMYVFGGSSSEHRDLCAPHLAQWKALVHAKALGARFYNFGGIEDPERKLYKGWEGLTTFKQRFGGELLTHSVYFDIVSNPILYFLYNGRKFLRSLFS